MNFIKNPTAALVIIVICVVIFFLANTAGIFGRIANKFFPCTQDPLTSFPCNMGYDIAAMIISALVGLTVVGVIVFKLISK